MQHIPASAAVRFMAVASIGQIKAVHGLMGSANSPRGIKILRDYVAHVISRADLSGKGGLRYA